MRSLRNILLFSILFFLSSCYRKAYISCDIQKKDQVLRNTRQIEDNTSKIRLIQSLYQQHKAIIPVIDSLRYENSRIQAENERLSNKSN